MNINVLLSVENYIANVGLHTIVSNSLLASNITQVNKNEIVQKIKLSSFDILFINYKKNCDSDFELINQIIKTDSKIKLFILTSSGVDHKIKRFSNKNNIGVILDTFSQKTIIELLNFSHLNFKSRIPLRLRKKEKTQNITNLLSDKELEIALMLVKGQTITTISKNNNLAITTVSTFKKRIFEKIKVKNLIELAELFKKLNPKVELK